MKNKGRHDKILLFCPYVKDIISLCFLKNLAHGYNIPAYAIDLQNQIKIIRYEDPGFSWKNLIKDSKIYIRLHGHPNSNHVGAAGYKFTAAELAKYFGERLEHIKGSITISMLVCFAAFSSTNDPLQSFAGKFHCILKKQYSINSKLTARNTALQTCPSILRTKTLSPWGTKNVIDVCNAKGYWQELTRNLQAEIILSLSGTIHHQLRTKILFYWENDTQYAKFVDY